MNSFFRGTYHNVADPPQKVFWIQLRFWANLPKVTLFSTKQFAHSQ